MRVYEFRNFLYNNNYFFLYGIKILKESMLLKLKILKYNKVIYEFLSEYFNMDGMFFFRF